MAHGARSSPDRGASHIALRRLGGSEQRLGFASIGALILIWATVFLPGETGGAASVGTLARLAWTLLVICAYFIIPRGPRDFYGGLALVALSVGAMWGVAELAGMQGSAFGPGTAPRMFAGLLAAIGILIAFVGVLFPGEPLERFAFRGPSYVLVAILLFALTIRGFDIELFKLHLRLPPLGLVPATFATFVVAIMGSTEMRWVESLIAACVMTAFCVGLFVYLLQLPFQLWPSF